MGKESGQARGTRADPNSPQPASITEDPRHGPFYRSLDTLLHAAGQRLLARHVPDNARDELASHLIQRIATPAARLKPLESTRSKCVFLLGHCTRNSHGLARQGWVPMSRRAERGGAREKVPRTGIERV